MATHYRVAGAILPNQWQLVEFTHPLGPAVIVSDGGLVAAQVTVEEIASAATLWGAVPIAGNTAQVCGPITGVRLFAGPAGAQFALLATDRR